VGGRPCYRFRGMRFKFKHSVHQVLISDASLNMGYVFLRCVLLVRQEGGSALWRFYLFFFLFSFVLPSLQYPRMGARVRRGYMLMNIPGFFFFTFRP